MPRCGGRARGGEVKELLGQLVSLGRAEGAGNHNMSSAFAMVGAEVSRGAVRDGDALAGHTFSNLGLAIPG